MENRGPTLMDVTLTQQALDQEVMGGEGRVDELHLSFVAPGMCVAEVNPCAINADIFLL
jgi:hypothetical protein